MVITEEMVMVSPFVQGQGKYVTEASTIGLKVGDEFPQRLATTLGNGKDFILSEVYADFAEYNQDSGSVLKVFND